MTGILLAGGDYVCANWGRWVVHCSGAFCFNAMQVYPGQTFVTCTDCETTLGPLVWPADPDGVETLLLMRPDMRTRNWNPGETLQDLISENIVHGILPPGVQAIPGAPAQILMRTSGDSVAGGAVAACLRSDIRRHEIERTAPDGMEYTPDGRE